jgi:hypothetical protein
MKSAIRIIPIVVGLGALLFAYNAESLLGGILAVLLILGAMIAK